MNRRDRENALLVAACYGSDFMPEILDDSASKPMGFKGRFAEVDEARRRRALALLLAPALRPMPKTKRPKPKLKRDVPVISTPKHDWITEGF